MDRRTDGRDDDVGFIFLGNLGFAVHVEPTTGTQAQHFIEPLLHLFLALGAADERTRRRVFVDEIALDDVEDAANDT